MTRFADPTRCPDCGAAITPGALSCDRCRLPLRGMTAQRLFATLSQADVLLAELRAAAAPVAATVAAPASGAVPPPPEAWSPPASGQPAPARPRGMSAVSVPRILLTVGAGCLLVAALVFLAVAWSVLGVGGRTVVLVGFTAVSGVLAGWLADRGLRAATEALALVGYGLLTLDVVGAVNAGWFGDLSTTGVLTLLGTMLAVTGAAGTLAVRRTSLTGLVGGEIVSAIGVGLVVLGIDLAGWLPQSALLVIATLVAAAAVVVLHRSRLLVATSGSAAVTIIAWLALLVYALDRVGMHDTSWRSLWADGHPVPLLAAAVIVAALALVGRLPLAVRIGAAAVGETLVGYAALAPAVHLGPTRVTLVVLAVLVAVSAAARLLPRPWGLVNLLTQAVAGVTVLVAGLGLGIRSLARLVAMAEPVWGGGPGTLLPAAPRGDIVPAPWLLPLCVAGLLGAAWSVAAASGSKPGSAIADLQVWSAVLAATATATVALYPVPVWIPEAMLLATGAGFLAWWLATGRPAPLALSFSFTAAGLGVSLHSDTLTAAALLALLVVVVLAQLLTRYAEVAAVAGALLAATLGASAWTWGSVLDAEGVWVALTGLLVLAVLVLVAPYAPSRWWRHPGDARIGIEIGAAATALPLALAGVVTAAAGRQADWTAVYLTTAGLAVTLMSLLRADRRELGWAGGLLLALASWVRLWDLGVTAPEAYTLPSAAALLVVGVVHLRRNAGSSTMTALAPGLSLALVPSLLWTLGDPTGLRPLLLGLGCLALVLAGLGLRWTAPIVLGATVGALLVLRLAGPYVAAAVPRWVLIGMAGALLVALGATWERRLTEARQLVGYVRALR